MIIPNAVLRSMLNCSFSVTGVSLVIVDFDYVDRPRGK